MAVTETLDKSHIEHSLSPCDSLLLSQHVPAESPRGDGINGRVNRARSGGVACEHGPAFRHCPAVRLSGEAAVQLSHVPLH
jgi:hypothetical protein